MAAEPKFTEQFPVVGTPTHRRKIEEEAAEDGMSMAAVVRRALDQRYGLVNGEESPAPSGGTKG